MVDVESLTDAEVQTKLTEYGFPVMPITGTTRKVMIKKLKLLMENQGKSISDRRSLGKLSSDEESESDVKLAKKDKNRRITMAVPPMQQHKVKVHQDEPSKDMEPPSVVPKEKKKYSARPTKIIVKVQESPDTNSDSEPEIIETDYKKEVPKNQTTATKKESSPPPTVTSRSTNVTSQYSTHVTSTSEQLDKIRARLSLGSGPHYVPKYIPPTHDDQHKDNDDDLTPFLSNFTRRLQANKTGDVNSPPRSDHPADFDTNGSSFARGSYLNRPRGREYSRSVYGGNTEELTNKSSNVSFILIAAAGLFFIVLFALYYGMHSGSMDGDIIGKTVKYEPQDAL